MDMVFTVIGWIIGLYAAFMLILAIGFSLGGAANTGNSDLSIMSIGSTLLLFYLIYKGFTFFFGSDDTDVVKRYTPPVVQTVQYDTTPVDVTDIKPPAAQAITEHEVLTTETKIAPTVTTAKTVPTVKKGYFDDKPFIPWIFYSFMFLSYLFWLFKPSKAKQTQKELAKKKMIATMMFKKDASGLQAWNPDWKPDEQL